VDDWFFPNRQTEEGTMQAWIQMRAKTRRDGRLVFITSVAFDAHVFDALCLRVHRERQRSGIVSEAVRDALSRPGWIEATLLRISGDELAVENVRDVPSSNSRIHARNGADGPATRRSPASRPPSRKAPSSKGGKKTKTPRK